MVGNLLRKTMTDIFANVTKKKIVTKSLVDDEYITMYIQQWISTYIDISIDSQMCGGK